MINYSDEGWQGRNWNTGASTSSADEKVRICRENPLAGFLSSKNKSLYRILTNDSIF